MAIKRERSNYLIQSVKHATEVLEALANAKEEVGITALSKQLGLHKNNVFRLLATLSLQGLVQQNPKSEDYSLGPACLKLGQSYLLNSDLISRIRPYIQELNENIDETVSFARLINNLVHFPISITSKSAVAVSPRVAKSLKAESCAVGRLLMSKETDLINQKDSKILSLREQELCSDAGQLDKDVLTICMIVRGIANAPIGAIEIQAPMYRANQDSIIKQLDKTVKAINSCFSVDNTTSNIKLTQQIQTEVLKNQSLNSEQSANL